MTHAVPETAAKMPALPAALVAALTRFAKERGFTRRESTVFFELFRGDASVRAIATQLEISENTVNNHLKRLFKKTGAHTRTDIVVLFVLDSYQPRPSVALATPVWLHPEHGVVDYDGHAFDLGSTKP